MLSITQLIQSGGLLLIAAIVFSESGMLVGFFLPGDTLLIGAGVIASQGKLPLLWLIVVVALAAIIGDNVGYYIGKGAGPRLFTKKDGILFRHEYIVRAEGFYEKHGGKTVMIARFIPIIRTFAPVVAGVGKMSHKKFIAFTIAGGLAWSAGIILLGYWFGTKVPNLDRYIQYVIAAVVLLSLGLSVWHILKDKDSRQRISERIRSLFKH